MRSIFILFMIALTPLAFSQDLARFSVRPVPGAGVSPVAIPLDGIDYNTDDGRIALFESGRRGQEIPSQIERGTVARLWFLFDNSDGRKSYAIRLVKDDAQVQSTLAVEQDDKVTTVKTGDKPVFSYMHAIMMPPEGVDLRFQRSGFIHPLWSPGGEILTRIQAPDHYHHYGLWNPWTMTSFDGRKVDFWNLRSGQGTVRFAGYLGAEEGPVFAGMKALQEHIAFIAPGEELVAINEVWDVRVWATDNPRVNIMDFTSTLNSPLPNGIMLDAYRYGGGLGYRATEKWHQENSTVLTSEGLERAEADGTDARWCIIEGESSVSEGRSGVVFLSHPSNRKHPEPMRVWPLNQNGRGDLYFQFTPIRNDDWKLEPNQTYTQKYRLIIFDGKITPQEAEKYWKSFAASPVVRFN